MRHCVLRDAKRRDDYQRILDQLIKLKKDGAILCPLSLPLVTELIRQTSGETLNATVKLMDELSDGDAFFCDKSLKHKLTTSPLRFDKAYATVILADPDAMLDYLMRIETE